MAQEFGCHCYWRIFLFQDIDGPWRLSPKFNEEQNWHPRVLQPSKCTFLSEQSWTLEDTPHFPEAAYVTAAKRCKQELWCFEVGLPSKWPGTSWRWVGANAPREENFGNFFDGGAWDGSLGSALVFLEICRRDHHGHAVLQLKWRGRTSNVSSNDGSAWINLAASHFFTYKRRCGAIFWNGVFHHVPASGFWDYQTVSLSTKPWRSLESWENPSV